MGRMTRCDVQRMMQKGHTPVPGSSLLSLSLHFPSPPKHFL
jgi:hypothetical protein